MLSSQYFNRSEDVKYFFRGNGSFGETNGSVTREVGKISHASAGYQFTCTYSEDPYGVFSRRDSFVNISGVPMQVNSLKSRFIFDGGEYEVYTQFNNWQTESMGVWQPLVTGVVSACSSVRTTQNAAPMLVLWSKQENRGVVFHLLPNCAWEMKVSRVQIFGKYTQVLVELGPSDYNLNLTLQAGEEVELPEIICYETKNRLDFDAYKLHNYMHQNYPRKERAFIYNTWMYRFTRFTVEGLFEQAKLASEMGLDYFVVDAGWFGKGGSWFTHVGDWAENKTGGLFGRMKELSDHVRSLGMKFGIWLEPERAGKDSDIVQSNSSEFFYEDNHYFLDFSNPKAYDRIMRTVCGLIEEYNLEYIKFDYNANMYYDSQRSSFLTYSKYQTKFLKELREKYPNLYMSCCAGGGERTDLANYRLYNSFWPTDNESPYIGMRIFRDTILRMPPQGFEKWTCIHSMDKYLDLYAPFSGEYGADERIIASGDAAWCDLHGVRRTYLAGYHTASPVGFSCDLSAVTDELRAYFTKWIAGEKAEEAFWKNAVARILAATETVTVFQYSDMALKKNVIQIVTGETRQGSIRVYPALSPEKHYCINGTGIKTGKEICDHGIFAEIPRWNDVVEIVIEEV